MSYEDARIDLLGDLLKKSRLLSASSVKRCKGHTPLASAQESTDDSDEEGRWGCSGQGTPNKLSRQRSQGESSIYDSNGSLSLQTIASIIFFYAWYHTGNKDHAMAFALSFELAVFINLDGLHVPTQRVDSDGDEIYQPGLDRTEREEESDSAAECEVLQEQPGASRVRQKREPTLAGRRVEQEDRSAFVQEMPEQSDGMVAQATHQVAQTFPQSQGGQQTEALLGQDSPVQSCRNRGSKRKQSQPVRRCHEPDSGLAPVQKRGLPFDQEKEPLAGHEQDVLPGQRQEDDQADPGGVLQEAADIEQPSGPQIPQNSARARKAKGSQRKPGRKPKQLLRIAHANNIKQQLLGDGKGGSETQKETSAQLDSLGQSCSDSDTSNSEDSYSPRRGHSHKVFSLTNLRPGMVILMRTEPETAEDWTRLWSLGRLLKMHPVRKTVDVLWLKPSINSTSEESLRSKWQPWTWGGTKPWISEGLSFNSVQYGLRLPKSGFFDPDDLPVLISEVARLEALSALHAGTSETPQ